MSGPAISLFVTLLLETASAHAQTAPWEGSVFAADPVAIVSFAQQIKPDAYAEATVFLNEYRLTLDSANRGKLVRHMVYRVETKAAIENCTTHTYFVMPVDERIGMGCGAHAKGGWQ